MDVVVFRELREEGLFAAFQEQGLEALRAGHGVEFRESGLQRRFVLPGQRAGLLVKPLAPLGLPAGGGIDETRQILNGASAVVEFGQPAEDCLGQVIFVELGRDERVESVGLFG